jgi:sulfide:quinone oxidoreductase
MLVSRGISYHPKKKLVEVKPNRVRFEDGEEMEFDLLMAVPPHRAPKPVVDGGLTDQSGWVPVNPQMLATKYNDVYAIGDVTAVETPHGHMPFLPKAGIFAQGQAEVVANNLAFSITGKGAKKAWDGSGYCYLGVSKAESAFLKGSFLSNPPRLEFHPPRRKFQMEKVAWEKRWMKERF